MAEANFVDAVFVEPDADFTEDQIEYLTAGLTGEDRLVARQLLQYRPTRKLQARLPRLSTLLGSISEGILWPNSANFAGAVPFPAEGLEWLLQPLACDPEAA